MIRRCRPLLGTFVEIAAPPGCAAAVEAGFAAVSQVHRLMSFHGEDSDLARLRHAPAGAPVVLASETMTVLRLALALHRESAGLFDIAVGARLVRAGFLPLPAGIELAACTGSSAELELRDDCRAVCHRPMLLDLGGIAKGFAVDRALAAMRAAGAEGGLINAGGDMRAFGEHAFDVDIRSAGGHVERRWSLRDQALASSDNAASRRRRWGRTVTPHIGFGRPLRNRRVVTVVAPDCATADALTKVAMGDAPLAARMLRGRGGFLLSPAMEQARAA